MITKKNKIFTIHHLDSRNLDHIVDRKMVDVTITSPPYYDMKDYGHQNQIGYGQEYPAYLNDLKAVFDQVYKITKDSGTLWVIINAFRKDGELVPLPFDFAGKIKECGWKLQEIIIWSKDRTVPWTHIGQMRHMFEYILVFSKGQEYKYHIDRIKDYVNLKKWWVKYPERYNPKGKTPAEIWNFDIPTQGSWGKSYIRHFCPLPGALVNRIIQLTTDEKDVVLDPFAGSGAVLLQAAFTNRQYIGFELNRRYIEMFKSYLRRNAVREQKVYKSSKKSILGQQQFEDTVINLRVLKLAKILRRQLLGQGFKNLKSVYVERLATSPRDTLKIIAARYTILAGERQSTGKLLAAAERCISKPPLSKYGVEATFEVRKDIDGFREKMRASKLYMYAANNTHSYLRELRKSDVTARVPILSPIAVRLSERDFE